MKSIMKQCGLGSIGGTSVLGERGQVVIPKETRDRLKLKTGDGFLVIEHFGKIILIRQKMADKFINYLTKEFNKINKK